MSLCPTVVVRLSYMPRINVRLSEGLLRNLRHEAQLNGIGFSEHVRRILSREEATQAPLSEVDYSDDIADLNRRLTYIEELARGQS